MNRFFLILLISSLFSFTQAAVAPTIVSDPHDVTANVGQSVVFEVTATGSAVLTYQWQTAPFGSATFSNISGAKTAIYTKSSLIASDNGRSFRCVVKNSLGTVTSSAAVLTVQFPPKITSNPKKISTIAGQSATFSVVATGNPRPAYQWQSALTGSATFTAIEGATTANYTIPVLASWDHGYDYRCLVTNPLGSATSAAASLTVKAIPDILLQPENGTGNLGQKIMFSVFAVGNPAPKYQWQSAPAGSATFTNLAGARLADYTTPALTAKMNGMQYRCVVSNVQGSVKSRIVTATLNVLPTFTQSPQDQTVIAGTYALFEVEASGNPEPTYQWQTSINGSSWNNLADQTTQTLFVPNTQISDNGTQYRVIATNVGGSATSGVANLSVVALPTISVGPQDQAIAVGSSATFSVVATGSPAPTYQWQVSQDAATWENVNNAIQESLVVVAETVEMHASWYRVLITNSAGTVSSMPALLRVSLAYPSVSWPSLLPMNQGNPLTAEQLCAQASVPGSFLYTPALGSVLPVGRQTLSATFAPMDSGMFAPVSIQTTIQVRPSTGPFQWARFLARDEVTPEMVARDGTLESAYLTAPGHIKTVQWNGDNQAGGRSFGTGNVLIGAPSKNYWIGLGEWDILVGGDYLDAWVFTPLFAQDSHLRFGFSATQGALITPVNGQGPALAGVFTSDAIVVELAWRNFVGAQPRWQNTWYSGNPLQAAIWQIKAGQTAGEAQCDVNNRLALIPILTETTPLSNVRFKLLCPGGGLWQLQIDLDGDGQADITSDSAQTGNRLATVTGVSQESGLWITTEPSSGSRTGQIAKSNTEILYEESDSTWIGLGRDSRPMTVNAPKASIVSPAAITGKTWRSTDSVQVSGTTFPGGSGTAYRFPDGGFCIEMPLTSGQDAQAVITQNNSALGMQTVKIAWTPTDLSKVSDVTIRASDSLLLTCTADYPEEVHLLIDPYGDGNLVNLGDLLQNPSRAVQYSTAGIYVAKAYMDTNNDGLAQESECIGTTRINVVSIQVPQQISAQLGYVRPVIAHCGGGLLGTDVTVEAQNIQTCKVQVLASSGPWMLFTVQALKNEAQTLHFKRILDPNRILLSQTFRPFILEILARNGMITSGKTGMGTTKLRMHPHVPHNELRPEMFAHKATFAGGERAFSVDTDGNPASNGGPGMEVKTDPVTKEVYGELQFDVGLTPGESMSCFSVKSFEYDRFSANPPVSAGLQALSGATNLGMQAASDGSSQTQNGSGSSGGSVNVVTCTIECFQSLLFVKANDPVENEFLLNPTKENWNPGTPWDILVRDSCTPGKPDECKKIKYHLEIDTILPAKEVEPMKGEIPRVKMTFGNGTSSNTRECVGGCAAIDIGNTGTYIAYYNTKVVMEEGEATASGYGFWVAELDAHGLNGPRSIMPDIAACLPKLKGSPYDPVIIMDQGGCKRYGGGDLYGLSGGFGPDCPKLNTWTLRAGIKPEYLIDRRGNEIKGYSIRWRMSDGVFTKGSNIPLFTVPMAAVKISKDEPAPPVTFDVPPGRYKPRLEVWHKKDDQSVDHLVGYAEIHDLVVEPKPSDSIPSAGDSVANSVRIGTPIHITNFNSDDNPIAVDMMTWIEPAGESRGRMSPDGYPQNQYWVGDGDGYDLPQVMGIPHGREKEDVTNFDTDGTLPVIPQRVWLQGYGKPSKSTKDLTLKVQGQSFVEACENCNILGKTVKPLGNYGFVDTDTEQITSLGVHILVDNDRDHVMDETKDWTSPVRAYRFWVNDDKDRVVPTEDKYGKYTEEDDLDPASGGTDNTLETIPCPRDLEDWTRMNFEFRGPWKALNNNKNENSERDPLIDSPWLTNRKLKSQFWRYTQWDPNGFSLLFRHNADPNGSVKYLTDRPAVGNNVDPLAAWPYATGTVGRQMQKPGMDDPEFTDIFDITGDPNLDHVSNPTSDILCPWIFMARQKCEGELEAPMKLSLLKSMISVRISQPNLFLKFQKCEDFYDVHSAGTGTTFADMRDIFPIKPILSKTDDYYDPSPYLLLVHGWNLQEHEKIHLLGETSYKRLWWNGYKGRYGTLRWPTDYYTTPIPGPNNFDGSEFTAYHVGEKLAIYLPQLKQAVDCKIDLMGHSMGNIVVSNAIRVLNEPLNEPSAIRKYLACQAAVSTHTYTPIYGSTDPSFSEKLIPYNGNLIPGPEWSYGPETPNVYGNYNMIVPSKCEMINFVNHEDYALHPNVWGVNQALKPNIRKGSYYWGGQVQPVQDPQRLLGYLSLEPDYGTSLFRSRFYTCPRRTVQWRLWSGQEYDVNVSSDWDHRSFLSYTHEAMQNQQYYIMSYLAESRAWPLGTAVNSTSIENIIDLPNEVWQNILWKEPRNCVSTVYPQKGINKFLAHRWHSAQFRMAIMEQKDFWKKIKSSLDCPPIGELP